MEYAKDEIFNITYNESADRLQIKKEKKTSKLWHKIKKHKFISMIFLLFFIFSVINIILINYFMAVLQKLY